MNFSEDIYNDKIWPYLTDSLNELEKRAFEKEMLANSLLRDEVEACRELIDNLNYLGIEQKVNKWFPHKKAGVFELIFKNKSALRIAAGILVFLVAGFWVWNIKQQDTPGLAEEKPGKDSSPVEGFSDRISPEDLLANHLVLPIENAPEKFESAVDKINENQTQRGISELLAINRRTVSENKDDEHVFGAPAAKPAEPYGLSREEELYQNLYLGIAYLKSKEYEKALTHLKNAQGNKEAQWYLALTCLAQNDIPQAIELARSVAEDKQNHFRLQAEQLIEQLEKW